MSAGELAVIASQVPDGMLEQIQTAKGQIAKSDPETLAQIIAFAEAVGIAARARVAIDLAREAAETRIRALRRLGELIIQAPSDDAREELWLIVPAGRGYGRCDELGALPSKLFNRAVRELLEQDGALLPYAVIRHGTVLSLKAVERGIWIAFDGSYWITAGAKKRTYIGDGDSLEEARRALKLKANPTLKSVAELHGKARVFAQQIELLGERMRGPERKLVAEAELLQAKVAALLYEAYRTGGGIA